MAWDAAEFHVSKKIISKWSLVLEKMLFYTCFQKIVCKLFSLEYIESE